MSANEPVTNNAAGAMEQPVPTLKVIVDAAPGDEALASRISKVVEHELGIVVRLFNIRHVSPPSQASANPLTACPLAITDVLQALGQLSTIPFTSPPTP